MSDGKKKASNVSSSSFFDLKAEISKKEDQVAKNRAAGRTYTTSQTRPAPSSEKKVSKWAKPNKGVQGRAARDVVELEAISRPTLETARAALERKAKIYDQLRKGKTGGFNDKQYGELLVDFDQVEDRYVAGSDDEDESLKVPTEDDPLIEYEDEFGRLRTAPRSEIPRHLLKKEDEVSDDYVIYNPTHHFPIYQRTDDEIKQINAAFAEENNPINKHYDASAEVRAKGAGFYQFSGDKDAREAQMNDLLAVRDETTKTRAATGASDVELGEVIGMQAGISTKSKAIEKRKRDLEERRKAIDAKRKKVAPSTTSSDNAADAFLADLEKEFASKSAQQ